MLGKETRKEGGGWGVKIANSHANIAENIVRKEQYENLNSMTYTYPHNILLDYYYIYNKPVLLSYFLTKMFYCNNKEECINEKQIDL